jgi:hypothetical protein
MNNIEDMQKSFEGQKFKVFSPFKCDISKNEDGNYVDDTTIFAFAWFCRGIASQAQREPMKLFAYMEDVEDLRDGKDVIRLYKHKAAVLDPVEVRILLPPAPEGEKE